MSGDSQSAPFDATLPNPLVVKVTDSSGKPVSNAPVSWLIQLDGAPPAQHITTTNSSGQTQYAPLMAGTPGVFAISAAINPQSVTFSGSTKLTLATGLKNIQSGEFGSCGLTAQGAAFCWGNGEAGYLGNGDTSAMVGPQPVSGGYTFTQLSMGPHLGCGLTASGALYCWGDPSYGELGNGSKTTTPVMTPIHTATGLTFTAISMGDDAACGIASSTTYCWGAGALGNGSSGSSYSPVAVQPPAGVTFTSVSVGWAFACGLTASGAAYCWGGNGHGQLGVGDSSASPVTVPTAVAGGHSFTQIATGSLGACGLTSAGAVYCWGTSVNGNGTSTDEVSPTAIQQSGLTFTQITMIGVHACALTTTGAAYCWGDNTSGELGGPGSGLTPVAVSGGYTFSTIVAGDLFTCGYTKSTTMYCWGSNSLWQIGLGIVLGDTVFTSPQPIPGLQ